mmetsp:Transcript_20265/g.48725  ORF Transcript_20265/g.48725 Transcript_20265/m.48725 type:complete len:770 (-) Transcript_20265:62-2371(-)
MTGTFDEDDDRVSRHQFFFPSEFLHSKNAMCSSARMIASCPTIIDHAIIICHKDRASFYKSTRKIRRTTDRIWSALFSDSSSERDGGSTQSCCVAGDGYFVGEDLSLCCESKEDSSDSAAICKRMCSEFGPCSSITNGVPGVAVSKFSAGDGRGIASFASKEEMSVVDTMFFDLDSVTKECIDLTTVDMMQKVLSMRMQSESGKGTKNSIVHLRSATMYRILTSIKTTLNNGVSEGTTYVSDNQLEKYLKSCQGESDETFNTPSSTCSNSVIRRLRASKGAANCPLTIYPSRFIELPSCSPSSNGNDREAVRAVEICRFYNYDAERGCLRAKKAKLNSKVKGCDMDHDHCHRCGGRHRAFECDVVDNTQDDDNLSSVVFRKTPNGGIVSLPFHGHSSGPDSLQYATSRPALLVLGGRLRGRTLATCEMLPLLSSSSNDGNEHNWTPLPNLCEHRGSHAACSPIGSGLAFVLGGGTADGNSDAVETLNFSSTQNDAYGIDSNTEWQWRWHTMAGKLSSPRHAFGAVTCVSSKKDTMTSASIFAVGGWKYGSVSCESMERLSFEYNSESEDASNKHLVDSEWLHNHARWELCAPLKLPRRLHSVATNTDGTSIFVFGGFIDERRTTNSIERYDINSDKWSSLDELPYGEYNCPLVQAVADQESFLIFPYSAKQDNGNKAPLVLRYTPGSDKLFSQIPVPNDDSQQLRLPISNWHSFSATSSTSLNKAYLVGGTINGKWTNRSFELDLDTLEWKELPLMTFCRRRLATLVLE